METYILMGIFLVVWIVTLVVVRLLMKSSPSSFVVGSVAGIMMGLAAGGAYYTHLAACRTCL